METNGIVHLSELPENEVCIRLPKKIQEKMFLLASRLAGNNAKLAKTLDTNRITLLDFKKSRFASTRLKIVKKLSEFLVQNGHEEYSLNNLERKILAIKTHWVGKFIFNPKFPINFNSESGARVVASILYDGGITANKYPFYTNTESYLIKRNLNDVKAVVGETEYHVSKQSTGTIQLSLPKILGLILMEGLNIPKGKKIFANPKIPQFIFSSPENVKKAFLQQAFDDEGSPSPGKNTKGRNVELPQSGNLKEPPLRLVGLKDLIMQFNIPVNGPYYVSNYISKNGTETHQWSIQITNQRDIRKFAERINFSLPRKVNKLENVLNSYVLPEKYKKGENLKIAHMACHALKHFNEPITIRNVAKMINRTELHTKDIMNALVTNDKLIIIKPKGNPTYFGEGFKPKIFDLKHFHNNVMKK